MEGAAQGTVVALAPQPAVNPATHRQCQMDLALRVMQQEFHEIARLQTVIVEIDKPLAATTSEIAAPL